MSFIRKLFRDPQPTQPEKNPFDMHERQKPKPAGKLDQRFVEVISEAEQESRGKIQQMQASGINTLLSERERLGYVITRKQRAEQEPSDTLDPFEAHESRLNADFNHRKLVEEIYGKTRRLIPTGLRPVREFEAPSEAAAGPIPAPAASTRPTTPPQARNRPPSPFVSQKQQPHVEEIPQDILDQFDWDDELPPRLQPQESTSPDLPPTQIRGKPVFPPAATAEQKKLGEVVFVDEDEAEGKPVRQSLPGFAPVGVARVVPMYDFEPVTDSDSEDNDRLPPPKAFAEEPPVDPSETFYTSLYQSFLDRQRNHHPEEEEQPALFASAEESHATAANHHQDPQQEEIFVPNQRQEAPRTPLPQPAEFAPTEDNPAPVVNHLNPEHAEILERERIREHGTLEDLENHSRTLLQSIQRRELAEVVQTAPQTQGAVRTLINHVSTVANVLFYLSTSRLSGNPLF